MSDKTIAPLTLEGWYVLHQFLDVGPGFRGEGGAGEDAADRAESVARLFAGWQDLGDGGWSGLYRIVGGGTDYMAVHFRSTLDELGEVERSLRRCESARELIRTADYLSVVELGLYTVTAALLEQAEEEGIEYGSDEWRSMIGEVLERERGKTYTRGRLYPRQPDEMPYVCFYPMDKRRNVGQNWYALPVDQRARLMHDHGSTGRRYAGRVRQVITGSVGLDDWEWAVTLFAGDPLVFKDLVTEMRYDEVSAVYADFGQFWVGHRIAAADIAEELAGG